MSIIDTDTGQDVRVGTLTAETFAAEMAAVAEQNEISVIIPIGQLEPYSFMLGCYAAECTCATCLEQPPGLRHCYPVMGLSVAVNGLQIAKAQFPNALVVVASDHLMSYFVMRPLIPLSPLLKIKSETNHPKGVM